MRSLRYTIELKEGVKVEMLFTPHLYSWKGYQGITFTAAGGREIFEVYADIMFCAALNAWVLDGKGTEDDFAFTRGDFHEFMTAEPAAFGKALDFALVALTGKGVKEYAKEAAEAKESGNADKNEGESKKKARITGWIGRRSKISS